MHQILTIHGLRICQALALAVLMILPACAPARDGQKVAEEGSPPDSESVPQSVSMGGAKSVTTFFVASRGVGSGGALGGLAGADAHCQALAVAEGSGDHTWRAYLSTAPSNGQGAVNARDRIGRGPWYNAEGELVAASIDQLHSPKNTVNKQTAVTERLDTVNGVGDTPNKHDILTGSRPDGTAFTDGEDLTCGNWTSNREGYAQVGHHDRMEDGQGADSWNSAHRSQGCSQQALERTGGAGLFYCFAVD